MRKRNILLAIGALEIMALPAAANIFSGFNLADRSMVIAAEIPIKIPGEKRYFLTSNAPFAIIGQNMTGSVRVDIQESGHIGEITYGMSAQLPGPEKTCIHSDISNPRIIYQADKATIASDGQTIAQSVLLKIHFEMESEPKFQFLTAKEFETYEPAKACKTDTN